MSSYTWHVWIRGAKGFLKVGLSILRHTSCGPGVLLGSLDKRIVRKGESAKIISENRGRVGIIGQQEFVWVLVLRKKQSILFSFYSFGLQLSRCSRRKRRERIVNRIENRCFIWDSGSSMPEGKFASGGIQRQNGQAQPRRS